MKNAYKIFFIVYGVILLLHAWGAINPTHDNWGFHFLGFYDTPIIIAAFGIIIFLFVPKVQTILIRYIERITGKLKKWHVSILFILVALVMIGAIYLLPAKLHLLGDGAILLRSVSRGITGDEITMSFKNQPLMFWIYRTAMKLHPFEASPNPYTVYYAIDIFALICFLGLVFFVLRYSDLQIIERILLGCFLIFLSGTQFFFGYIENYVLQYVITATYAITGWLTLEKRVSIAIPILCFILIIMLHLGNLIFLPSFILLIIYRSKSKSRAIIFLSVIGLIGVVVMSFVGFNLIDLTRHLTSGSVDFLQPFTAIGGGFPYAMFSLNHLVDWLDDLMLVAPFGIFIPAIIIPLLPKERRWKNSILQFLLLTSLCGLFFTWIINSGLGIARDWDLFASFFMPLSILSFYLLNQPIDVARRKNIIFSVVVVLLFHTAFWIGVNSSEEKHLARMQTLNSPKYLSKGTQLAYNEALANFFFDNHRYNDAEICYQRYMEIDATNPRITGNMADVLRMLGKNEQYFEMLKKCVAMNSPDPGVYSNLGVEYAKRKDTLKAIELNEKAVVLNPSMQKAHANLGILYMSQKNYKLSQQHFLTALNLGMRDAMLFRLLGDVDVFLKDYNQALQNYDAYLTINPKDQRVLNVRDQIYKFLNSVPQEQNK